MKKNDSFNQYVYILECTNGFYYTGYTTDIKRRYQEHVEGSSKCKYTRSFPPVKLAACWAIESNDASLALKIEKAIKRLSKQEKSMLIEQPESLKEIVVCDCRYKIIN